jgi:hypothetical protein
MDNGKRKLTDTGFLVVFLGTGLFTKNLLDGLFSRIMFLVAFSFGIGFSYQSTSTTKLQWPRPPDNSRTARF